MLGLGVVAGNSQAFVHLDMLQQARNKRDNLLVEFQGRRMTLAEAVELTGSDYRRAWKRLKRGMSIEQALAP